MKIIIRSQKVYEYENIEPGASKHCFISLFG